MNLSSPYWMENLCSLPTEAGSFRFLHVPPDKDLSAYVYLGTLTDGGAVVPRRIRTNEHGSTLDLGEIHVEKGLTLAGRLAGSDGKAVPSGIVVFARCPNADDTGLTLTLGESGRFEFKGLPPGPVLVSLLLPNDDNAKPYWISAKNSCRDPFGHHALEGQLDHDIADLTILLEPGREPHGNFDHDPTRIADFNDAKAGPITGVPPRP